MGPEDCEYAFPEQVLNYIRDLVFGQERGGGGGGIFSGIYRLYIATEGKRVGGKHCKVKYLNICISTFICTGCI